MNEHLAKLLITVIEQNGKLQEALIAQNSKLQNKLMSRDPMVYRQISETEMREDAAREAPKSPPAMSQEEMLRQLDSAYDEQFSMQPGFE